MKYTILTIILILSTAFLGLVSATPEKLITDHDVYVENEPIHVEIRDCLPNTTYLLEARSTSLYDYWYITTDARGVGYRNITISDDGNYVLNLRYPATLVGNIVARKNITILPLIFEIENSAYTGTNTYVPGDTIWAHVVAAPQRTYAVNITYVNRELFMREFTTDENGEYVVKINLPEFIEDGNDYRISLITPNKELISSIKFNVRSIVVNANTEKSVYLIEEVVRVFYSVVWIKNGTKVNDRRNEAIIYLDGGKTDYKEIYYSSGVIEFDLSIYKKHGVITPNRPLPYTITIWYNLSEYPKRFDDISIMFYTGRLDCDIQVYPLSGGFFANSDVEINIRSTAYNSWRGKSPASYAKINSIKIEKSEHWIREELPITNFPEKTGYNGVVSYIYHLPANLNVSTKIIITVNLSFGSEYDVESYAFIIESGATIKINLDKERYLAGDTMRVSLELQNSEGVGEPISYHLEVYTTENMLIYFADSSDSIFNVNIPEDTYGIMTVYGVIRTTMGYTFRSRVYVEVSYAYLDVVLSKSIYLPGDEITVSVRVESKVMEPPITYNFVIYAENVFAKNVTTTVPEFKFTVPQYNTPKSYSIHVSAMSKNYVVKGKTSAKLYNGYIVEVYVETPSAYTTNVYTPGQKVSFHYKVKVSGIVHSNIAILHYYIPNTKYEWYKNLDSMEGSVAIIIPNDLVGLQDIVFEVLSDGVPCIPSKASIYIDHSPAWGEFNVGGISIIDLIILVMVLVAILIGVLALRASSYRFTKRVPEEKKKKGPKPWEKESVEKTEITTEKSERPEEVKKESINQEITKKTEISDEGEIRDEL